MAGLLSFGSNFLAGVLIAYGAHGSVVKEILTTAANDAGQTDFAASQFDAAKIRAMVSGDFPPTPPTKPRKRRGRKANSKVVSFSDAFRSKHGRAPSGSEIKAQFPQLPVSTAYDYSARARKQV